MSKPTEQKLTGEDAWLANKRAIAKRNEEARDRAAKRGAVIDKKAAAQRREIARQERADLPSPPT